MDSGEIQRVVDDRRSDQGHGLCLTGAVAGICLELKIPEDVGIQARRRIVATASKRYRSPAYIAAEDHECCNGNL